VAETVTLRDVQDAVLDEFARGFGVVFEESPLAAWEEGAVEELCCSRYENEDWIFLSRRPGRFMGEATRKTPGGLITAHVALQGRAIESVMITGDFFTTGKLLNRAEAALKWIALDRGRIRLVLSDVFGKDGLHAVSADELADLVMAAAENAHAEAQSRAR
jgi:lipoate-protein ligase A